jgi:hypothetical protein
MYNNCYYYKIDEKAGLGQDEIGNNEPVYVEFKFSTEESVPEDEEQKMALALASDLNILPEYISSITMKEYLDNTDNENQETFRVK